MPQKIFGRPTSSSKKIVQPSSVQLFIENESRHEYELHKKPICVIDIRHLTLS